MGYYGKFYPYYCRDGKDLVKIDYLSYQEAQILKDKLFNEGFSLVQLGNKYVIFKYGDNIYGHYKDYVIN